MLESKKEIVDEDESEDSEDEKKKKKSKKKQRSGSKHTSNDQVERREDDQHDDEEEDDDDEENRPASFFRERKKGFEKESENEPEGLTESEAKDATLAIVEGLSRELREQFELADESSIAELETVAVAVFIDALREKVENNDNEVTDELLDEALREALEDVLGIDSATLSDLAHDQPENVSTVNGSTGPNTGNNNGANSGHGGSSGAGGGSGGRPNIHGGSNAANNSSAVAGFVAANMPTDGSKNTPQNSRGKGLLIGGVVGYIIGRRHGRKRAEAALRPEIEKLEDQIAELYEAISMREQLMKRVVFELAARNIGSQHSADIALQAKNMLGVSVPNNHEVSRSIQPPSLVVPVAFAALLVSSRLAADIAEEKHTWGKDFLVGGVAGYMVGRRHGRKKTEIRLRSEIEQLEYEVANLSMDVVNRDSVIDAMVRIVSETDNSVSQFTVIEDNDEDISKNRTYSRKNTPHDPESAALKPRTAIEEFVDMSIDRIAIYRKKREIQKHRQHLLKSGRAIAVGEFNLSSSVFLERRLVDGTENSPERKQIEIMDEGELLAMSQNIYVDGQSAIDLYDTGRVELEVLRESVKQHWRKTGDYEQTLRSNLKADESVLNDIRFNLENAYRSILENS